MKKDGNQKKIYRWMLFGMSLLCLAGMSAAGCGKRGVSYVNDGTENADENETAATEADAEPDTWEFFYPAKMESGNIVSVRIKVDIGSGPGTSEVMGIRRTVLEESTKRQIAETVLGDEVSLEDDVYSGSRDGIPYQMRMGQRTVSLYPADMIQLAPEELKNALTCALNTGEGISGNRCGLSQDEAVELAGQFLEEIGFSDRSLCCNVMPLVWTGQIEQRDDGGGRLMSITDGYAVFFEQTLNEEKMPQFAGNTVQKYIDIWFEEDGRERTYNEMHTVLCVDERGVIGMDMRNFYEVTSIEEDVSLLPVSTVCDIMEKELTDHADRYITRSEDDLYYKKMSFGYCLLWDDAGEYGSYVPVWELDDSIFELDSSKIVVNAIDGSIIPLEQRGG